VNSFSAFLASARAELRVDNMFGVKVMDKTVNLWCERAYPKGPVRLYPSEGSVQLYYR
jgi:hypothetical protein